MNKAPTWKRLLRTSTRSSSSMYSHTRLYSVCMLSGADQLRDNDKDHQPDEPRVKCHESFALRTLLR